jgi:hypothetical protein
VKGLVADAGRYQLEFMPYDKMQGGLEMLKCKGTVVCDKNEEL